MLVAGHLSILYHKYCEPAQSHLFSWMLNMDKIGGSENGVCQWGALVTDKKSATDWTHFRLVLLHLTVTTTVCTHPWSTYLQEEHYTHARCVQSQSYLYITFIPLATFLCSSSRVASSLESVWTPGESNNIQADWSTLGQLSSEVPVSNCSEPKPARPVRSERSL